MKNNDPRFHTLMEKKIVIISEKKYQHSAFKTTWFVFIKWPCLNSTLEHSRITIIEFDHDREIYLYVKTI